MDSVLCGPQTFTFAESLSDSCERVWKKDDGMGISMIARSIDFAMYREPPKRRLDICERVQRLKNMSHVCLTKVNSLVVPQGRSTVKVLEEDISGTPLSDQLHEIRHDPTKAIMVALGVATGMQVLYKHSIFPREIRTKDIIVLENGFPVLKRFYPEYLIADTEPKWDSDISRANMAHFLCELLVPETREESPNETTMLDSFFSGQWSKCMEKSDDKFYPSVCELLKTSAQECDQKRFDEFSAWIASTRDPKPVYLSTLDSMWLNPTSCVDVSEFVVFSRDMDEQFLRKRFEGELEQFRRLIEQAYDFSSSHSLFCADMLYCIHTPNANVYDVLFRQYKNGTLAEILDPSNKSHIDVLPRANISNIIMGIASCMCKLTQFGIALELKPDIVQLDENWNPKMLIWDIANAEMNRSIIENNVCQFGRIALRLLFRKDESEVVHMNQANFQALNRKDASKVHPEILSLFLQCMSDSPAGRPTFERIFGELRRRESGIYNVSGAAALSMVAYNRSIVDDMSGTVDFACVLDDGGSVKRFYAMRRWTQDRNPSASKSTVAELRHPPTIEANAFCASDWTGGVRVDPKSTVERVGECAFLGSSVSRVDMSVRSIDSLAFAFCQAVEQWNISFPTINKLSFGSFCHSSLTSFVISRQVTSIPSSCFQGCMNLSDFRFMDANRIVEIGDWAFSGCPITSIELPRVRTLGERAFYSCQKLNSVTLAADTKIGKCCFEGCVALNTVSVSESFSTEMAKAEGRIGARAFVGTKVQSVKLSKAQWFIGDEAFLATPLSSFECPTLKELGQGSFSQTKLKRFSLSPAVSVIPCRCFMECEDLEGFDFIDFPKSLLVRIEESAFEGTKKLELLRLPKQVTLIGKRAFYGSKAVVDARENSSLEEIGDSAFECSSLREFNLPKTTRVIGVRAFRKSNLKSLAIDKESCLVEIRDYAFSHIGALEKVSLPNTVRIIGAGAFKKSKALTSIEFDEDSVLESIGDEAFAGAKLRRFRIPYTTSAIGHNAFAGCKIRRLIMEENPCLVNVFPDSFPRKAQDMDLMVPILTPIQQALFPEWMQMPQEVVSVDMFCKAKDLLRCDEIIEQKKPDYSEFYRDLCVLGNTFLDSYSNYKLVSSEYPALSPAGLHHEDMLQIIGYLFDFQATRMSGVQLECSLLSCTYLLGSSKRSNNEIFERVLDIFGESAVAIEQATAQLMVIGKLVAHDWTRLDPEDVTTYTNTVKVRRCPDLDWIFKLKDISIYSPAEQKMIKFGRATATMIKLLRLFSKKGPVAPSEITGLTKQLLEAELPDIDEAVEAEHYVIIESGSDFFQTDRMPSDMRPTMCLFPGFQKEAALLFSRPYDFMRNKLRHKEAVAQWPQIWNDVNDMVALCKIISSSASAGQVGMLAIVRALMQWASHHQGRPGLARTLICMVAIPHSHLPKEPPVGVNAFFILPVGENSQRISMIKLLESEYHAYCRTPGGRMDNPALYWMYCLRMSLALPLTRSFESLEDLLIPRVNDFFGAHVEKAAFSFLTAHILHQFAFHGGLGLITGIYREPLQVILGLAYCGAVYNYIAACHNTSRTANKFGDPCFGNDCDPLTPVYSLLSKILTFSARIMVRALGFDDVTWAHIEYFPGYEMPARVNRLLKEKKVSFRHKSYYRLWGGACFPHLAKDLFSKASILTELGWVADIPDEKAVRKMWDIIFSILAKKPLSDLHKEVVRNVNDPATVDRFERWYQTVYNAKPGSATFDDISPVFVDLCFPVPLARE